MSLRRYYWDKAVIRDLQWQRLMFYRLKCWVPAVQIRGLSWQPNSPLDAPLLGIQPSVTLPILTTSCSNETHSISLQWSGIWSIYPNRQMSMAAWIVVVTISVSYWNKKLHQFLSTQWHLEWLLVQSWKYNENICEAKITENLPRQTSSANSATESMLARSRNL